MNPLWPALRRIVADLTAERVRCALVGGIATGARTEPRFTRDVDLAVAVADDSEAERLARALLARGYRVLMHLEQEATGRLATIRLLPPPEVGSDAIVDLLFASCGIESEVVAAAEPLALTADLTVPVAGRAHLIAMKTLSRSARRQQDSVDLARLIEGADAAELGRARAAMRLIVDRGSARGRDLVAEFDAFLAELGRNTQP